MIVRNESAVIRRCLESVRPFVGSWVIVDTGSTDDTEQVARATLDGLPGEFLHREWKGFGDARTAAFDAARGRADYALVVDADEVLAGSIGDLSLDAYAVWLAIGGVRYRQLRLFRLALPWRYEGVLHEYPTTGEPFSDGDVNDLVITSARDGARSADPKKYLRDAEVLEREVERDPSDARNVFYLAQSYRDAGVNHRAAQRYLERAEMGVGTNGEEVYISLLEAGRALERLGEGDRALRCFHRAYETWPARIEATRELARVFTHRTATSPRQGTLFVEP